MSTIIVRDSLGNELYNLQTHSTLVITGSTSVRNADGLVHDIAITDKPIGTSPIAFTGSNIPGSAFSDEHLFTVTYPTEGVVRITFLVPSTVTNLSTNVEYGYY